MAKEEVIPPSSHPQHLLQSKGSDSPRRSISTTSSFSSAFSDISSSSTSSPSASSSPAAPIDLLHSLVSDLYSPDPVVQLHSASELRLLSRDNPNNRLGIVKAGASLPLVSLLSHDDPSIQEHSVTALLNLSLLDRNRPILAAAGAVPALALPLRSGLPTTRAAAAAALFRLSSVPSQFPQVSLHIPLLVDLLRSPDPRGRKDAATALYALSARHPDNALRVVRAGAVNVLFDQIEEGADGIADKAACLLASLADQAVDARDDIAAAEDGIAILVNAVDRGVARRVREAAADVLLKVCEESAACRAAATRAGAILALASLSSSGSRGKKKADALLELLLKGRRSAKVFDVAA